MRDKKPVPIIAGAVGPDGDGVPSKKMRRPLGRLRAKMSKAYGGEKIALTDGHGEDREARGHRPRRGRHVLSGPLTDHHRPHSRAVADGTVRLVRGPGPEDVTVASARLGGFRGAATATGGSSHTTGQGTSRPRRAPREPQRAATGAGR